VDTRSLAPPRTPTEKPKTAPCAGCRESFPRRELVTVHDGRHDGLHFFDGDSVCKPCARRSRVTF
jgi:hypothetical protein